jgi:hypothetical protein
MHATATRGLALVLGLFLLGGCARAVQVGSPPGATYPIEVQNTLPVEMIVSYDDGSGTRALGTVLPNRLERFIIAAPRSTTITVDATDVQGTRRSGPHTVSLVAGVAQRVTLR